MPKGSVIAKNYAKALFLEAKKSNSLAQINKELNQFRDNFSTNLGHELKSPVISKNDITKIIAEISNKFNLSKLSSNFVATVVRNRRLNLFPEIYQEFFQLFKQYQNILEVEIIFANQPENQHIEQLKNLISKKYPGKNIAVKLTIKEKIIGGLQIKIGSQMIDISLENQIENIKQKCISAIK
jgi:F-type H+-transporting ATPase subunit delta